MIFVTYNLIETILILALPARLNKRYNERDCTYARTVTICLAR